MKLLESKLYKLNKQEMDLSFGFAGTTLVIQNPNKLEFQALYQRYNCLRGLADKNNLYFWSSEECSHDSMKNELKKQEGIILDKEYCGILYMDNKLYVDGYQYLNGNYDADPEELYAKNILLNNKCALQLFNKTVILNAKNHHISK